jgi:hypothetical protein
MSQKPSKIMERYEYYDGLDPKDLIYDRYLIFIIEAAAYCELNQTDCVRRACLKNNCDQTLGEYSKGVPSEMGGSFESIMNSQRYKNLFHVTRVKNKKQVLIYPHIPAIQEKIRRNKINNLNSGNGRLVFARKGESFLRTRSPKGVEVVSVSESLSRQTSKTRALNDSVQTSERLGIVVTRANQKKTSVQII